MIKVVIFQKTFIFIWLDTKKDKRNHEDQLDTKQTNLDLKTVKTVRKVIESSSKLYARTDYFSKLKMSTEVKDDLVSTLSVGGRDYQFYDVASFGDDYRRLPFCLRVLVKKSTKTDFIVTT